jgi:hypothetical protein
LANNAVTSDKIRNREIKAEDLESIIELGDGSGTLDVHIMQGDEILLGPGLVGETTPLIVHPEKFLLVEGLRVITGKW